MKSGYSLYIIQCRMKLQLVDEQVAFIKPISIVLTQYTCKVVGVYVGHFRSVAAKLCSNLTAIWLRGAAGYAVANWLRKWENGASGLPDDGHGWENVEETFWKNSEFHSMVGGGLWWVGLPTPNDNNSGPGSEFPSSSGLGSHRPVTPATRLSHPAPAQSWTTPYTPS